MIVEVAFWVVSTHRCSGEDSARAGIPAVLAGKNRTLELGLHPLRVFIKGPRYTRFAEYLVQSFALFSAFAVVALGSQVVWRVLAVFLGPRLASGAEALVSPRIRQSTQRQPLQAVPLGVRHGALKVLFR